MPKLNKKYIRQVADEIEAMPHARIDGFRPSKSGFNMSRWHDRSLDCGTVCCIGGHICPAGEYEDVAGKLGISKEAANNLCYPYVLGDDWSSIQPAVAARVLRNLADTGKVDWPAALRARGEA